VTARSRTKQGARKKAWQTYEEVARDLLGRMAKEFGVTFVEPKQKVHGQSGTTWEIDAKGIRQGNEGFVIVECRRYRTQKLNQAKAAALAFCISDTRAAGGIFVSPLGLQKSAAKIAKATNILHVKLNANSTPTDFALQFLDKLFLGVSAKAESKARIAPRLVRA
jgi:hypothetical protein